MKDSHSKGSSAPMMRLALLLGLGLGVAGLVRGSDPANCVPPQAATAGWWAGDGSGADLSGNDRPAVSTGGSFAAGKVGQAFSGSFDIPDFSIGSHWTVEAWVRADGNVGGGRTTALGAMLNCVDAGVGSNGGTLAGHIRQPGGCTTSLNSGISPVLGQWYHLALSSDGSTARFYVDGVERSAGAVDSNYVPSSNWQIGSEVCCGGNNWPGLIDEPTLYDRALSAAEIQGIYIAGDDGKCKTQACATSPPGLLSWYRMENDAKDSQGAHPGTTTPSFSSGKVGQGMAAGNAFQVADAADLHPQSFTVDAWVTHTDSGGNLPAAFVFANSGSDQAHGIELDTRPNGQVDFYINGGTTGGGLGAAPGSINDGQFHHLAGTYDGAVMRLYIDGTQVGQTAVVTTVNYEPGAPLVIGSRQNTGATYGWPGVIDEVQLFGRALSPQEIKALYAKGSAGQCADCTAKPANNVLWLKGDGDASDSSGSGNAGNLSGDATASAAGLVGQSFGLDGAGDYLSIADSASLRVTSVTLQAWISASADPGGSVIFSKSAGTLYDNSYALFFESGKLQGLVGTASSSGNRVAYPFSPTPGRWYHVAYSFDTLSNQQALYLDGVLVDSNTSSIDSIGYDAHPLYLGTESDAETLYYFFPGRIDEAQLFGRALSASEIETIYRAGSRGACVGVVCGAVPGSLGFATTPYTVSENAGTADLTVVRTGGSDGTVSVTYTSADGTATAGSDYSAVSGSLSWLDGDVSDRHILVPILQDTAAENTEAFGVGIGSAVCAVLSPGYEGAGVMIADDEPRLSFSTASISAAEGASNRTLKVNRVGGNSANAVSVDLLVTGGTASAADYQLSSSQLNWASGDTAAKTVTLNLARDNLDENNETLVLGLANPVAAGLGASSSASYLIGDVDPLPLASFQSASSSVSEAAGSASIGVTLSPASGRDVLLKYSLSGSASLGSDYGQPAYEIAIPAGTTTANISVPIRQDSLNEGDETLSLSLSYYGGAAAGSITSHTLSIQDDDTSCVPGTLAFSSASRIVEEGNSIPLTITRSGGSDCASVSVTLATTGGSATAGSDYTALNQTLTWLNGDSAPKTVNLVSLHDTTDEPHETILTTLSNPTAGASLGTASHTTTVNDNDPYPTASFQLASSSIGEAGGTANLVVNLSQASGQNVVLKYSLGGSATRGSDYATPAYQLSIPAGATSANVSIPILNDSLVEADETVIVTLSYYAYASAGAITSHTLSIVSDD